jgi:Protein of unknown function (DUF2891)
MAARAPESPNDLLTTERAAAFARVALANVGAEYPFHLAHYARAEAEIAPPRALHPVFHGSYDWHSCVHMHWTLMRTRRRLVDAELAVAIDAHFAARLRPQAVAAERAYCTARPGFERPYGWGWLLKLQAELHAAAASVAPAAAWRDQLAPLALLLADRLIEFLPRADFPVRAGTHGNSAFALLLALDYADAVQHRSLRRVIEQACHRWYGHDAQYPAHYEPGGDDFLSGGLVEAALMLRVVDGCDFADWWQQFAPTPAALTHWLRPVRVSDATDAKIVHLHGLNLSRAWCWGRLLPALERTLQTQAARAREAHLCASLTAATTGDYVGTHWLASFALLALDDVATQATRG